MPRRATLARRLVEHGGVRKSRRSELERADELAEARPYLDLAREIQAEVARVAADPDAHGETLTELIDRIPDEKRMEFAQGVFDRLPPDQQWAVVARVFGDDEIRTYLEAERAARLAHARGGTDRQELCRLARERHELDTRRVAAGERLTLGLFREADVGAAVKRGHLSTTAARRLVLRALGDARFQVLEDTFNPSRGYFVTGDYSEDTWRQHERLEGHVVIRVGSITDGETGPSFEPVVYPRGRLDVELGGRAAPGRLHLGFAILGDLDVFVP